MWITLCVSEGDPVLDDLWARLLETLARTLPTPVLDNWVRPCRLVAVEGDHLRIGAPNKFSRDWLAQNYLDALHQAARECLGGPPPLTLAALDLGRAPAHPAPGPLGRPR